MTHCAETRQKARDLYENSNLYIKQIIYQLGLGKKTLERWAREDEWNYRCRLKGHYHKTYIRRKVKHDYLTTKMPVAKIARIHGTSTRSVFYWIKRYNWSTRNTKHDNF